MRCLNYWVLLRGSGPTSLLTEHLSGMQLLYCSRASPPHLYAVPYLRPHCCSPGVFLQPWTWSSCHNSCLNQYIFSLPQGDHYKPHTSSKTLKKPMPSAIEYCQYSFQEKSRQYETTLYFWPYLVNTLLDYLLLLYRGK